MRQVKGVLFADYVRMVRSNKQVDWSRLLPSHDLAWLERRIDPEGWYPMDAFERLGNAILLRLARGSVDAARLWGRLSVDQLKAAQPMLVVAGDPVETLNRFRVLRATFFDFEALTLIELSDGEGALEIRYHMGPTAEEAATFQTIGFFERLLDLAGATDITARLAARSWVGDPRTLLQLSWHAPDGADHTTPDPLRLTPLKPERD